MRIAVTGADGVVGRGAAERLVCMGHSVVGLAPRRPPGWPGSVDFVAADLHSAAALDALAGADAVAHCAPLPPTTAPLSSARRVVVVLPAGEDVGLEADEHWVVLRCATVLGRDVDDAVLGRFAGPVVIDRSGGHGVQVVHPEDVQRLVVRALTDTDIAGGRIDLAAPGMLTVARIADAVGRFRIRLPGRRSGARPVVDTTRLTERWGYTPVWTAEDCLEDFRLAARGRVALGSRVASLPWRLPRVRDIHAADVPAADGVAPVPAGSPGTNGEFDTPIDPRFPAFAATNLSEALPGPFSPSSASVTLRGTRAAGMIIAERLRPGGMVQREMAVRTTGVFGHRLYAAITSAHFMAETVPFVNPEMIIESFFGRTTTGLPVFGPQRPPRQRNRVGRLAASVVIFGVNLVGLSAGARADTRAYVTDVERCESLAAQRTSLDDARLRALILEARDHVVHGWVLSSASIMVCTAYDVILRILCGRKVIATPGREVASAESLNAVQRLVVEARSDPDTCEALTESDRLLDALAERAPRFHSALMRELDVIGHRGPAEVEMRSPVYADDPELLARMVARAVEYPTRPAPRHARVPLLARPIAVLAARQLRDRELRRDRMVRAIWILRNLLREYGSRLTHSGTLDCVDDIFYLLVDELDAPPPATAKLISTRRQQQRTLAELVPPEAFNGSWQPTSVEEPELGAGETLHGLGVCAGRAKGRVRIITAESIDDLQPGEVLVTKVTDVGYTPAFAYTAAVVSELGGPLSHAAIVAREYGIPCVVNARDATNRLPAGALVEVDGVTGHITLLDE